MNVAHSLNKVIDPEAQKHLSILPLSTLLENIAGIYVTLLRGGSVCIPSRNETSLTGSSKLCIATLLGSLNAYQPNSMIILPEIASAMLASAEGGGVRRQLSWPVGDNYDGRLGSFLIFNGFAFL